MELANNMLLVWQESALAAINDGISRIDNMEYSNRLCLVYNMENNNIYLINVSCVKPATEKEIISRFTLEETLHEIAKQKSEGNLISFLERAGKLAATVAVEIIGCIKEYWSYQRHDFGKYTHDGGYIYRIGSLVGDEAEGWTGKAVANDGSIHKVYFSAAEDIDSIDFSTPDLII